MPVRALLQRVRGASVSVDGQTVGAIGVGLVALIGVTHTDTGAQAAQLARKVHEVRLLRNEQSIADVAESAVLVVSQFTLYGDGRKGRRPTWSAAARRQVAEPLVEAFASALRARGARVATGVFGGDMRLSLVNDGPVTLLLEV
jgi:D-tyrosyl-tRNA(Tyr) deacylase